MPQYCFSTPIVPFIHELGLFYPLSGTLPLILISRTLNIASQPFKTLHTETIFQGIQTHNLGGPIIFIPSTSNLINV